MSKLFNQYKSLKEKDNEKVYLFKSGIFYIAIDKDAQFLSDTIGFKLTNLNETIKKCGFPVSRIDYYKRIFDIGNINYEIIEESQVNVDLKNNDLNKLIKNLSNLDFDNITYKQAFEILQKASNELKQICKC